MDYFIPEGPAAGVDRFGRNFKSWREWNNAQDFLRNLNIEFNQDSLFCIASDRPDVIYGKIQFEIKEIMDEGRKRHDEVKKEIATHGRTLPFVPNPNKLLFDIFPADAADLVRKNLELYDTEEKYNNKYNRNFKSETDILFYINKRHHFFDDGEMPSPIIFEKYGWRSISCVIGSAVSIIFYAGAHAPALLKDRANKYFERL